MRNLLVSTAMTSDPGESCILATFQMPAAALRLCIRGAGASQMRQVHEIDGSEMTGRQEGTADRGCRDCPEMFNTNIYKNPRFPRSEALSYAISSIFSQPSNPMAFTHVYRLMEIAPLTVIPYKPKLQKPSNRNVHNLPSKPFVRQPSSLNASQGIDSGESSAETLPESNWLAKNAEELRGRSWKCCRPW